MFDLPGFSLVQLYAGMFHKASVFCPIQGLVVFKLIDLGRPRNLVRRSAVFQSCYIIQRDQAAFEDDPLVHSESEIKRDCLTIIKVAIDEYQLKTNFKGRGHPSQNFNFIKGTLCNSQKNYPVHVKQSNGAWTILDAGIFCPFACFLLFHLLLCHICSF